MHEHTPSALQPIFDKAITLGKVLQEVLVLVVVYVDCEMLERLEQLRV